MDELLDYILSASRTLDDAVPALYSPPPDHSLASASSLWMAGNSNYPSLPYIATTADSDFGLL